VVALTSAAIAPYHTAAPLAHRSLDLEV